MNNHEFSDRVVTEAETAKITSLSRPTLQRYRHDGVGPKFIRLGVRRIGYRLSDLAAWMAEKPAGGNDKREAI
jgi:predicted DNA-binding transcriptional regulator AlpA